MGVGGAGANQRSAATHGVTANHGVTADHVGVCRRCIG